MRPVHLSVRFSHLSLLAFCVAAGARFAETARAQSPKAADAALVAEIRALNDSMVATVARGDAAGVARFYADDGRLVGPRRSTVRGRTEIDRYWGSMKGAKAWRLEIIEVGGTRDAAYQVGVSSLTSTGSDGTERTYVSEFVVIWKRQPDGSLRIALDLYT
jgi:uncharacterized protein (TIGR02246 family)